jgi:hypothetical protein
VEGGDQSGLQFERAEFEAPAALGCAACKRPIGDSYFELNGHVICPPCRDRALAERGDGGGASRLARGTVFGLGAAALGTVVWYAVREITRLEIGLIAIGIGIAVGVGVRRGARGRGGPAYQILAVLLTYLSIASANAPLVWNGVHRAIAVEVARQATAQSSGAGGTPPVSPDSDAVKARVGEVIAHLPLVTWLWFAWVVLKSPFFGGAQNIIGWLIIFFGLQQAWRLTRALPFALSGPFSLAERASPR